MIEKTYATPSGTIHYWIHIMDDDVATQVSEPGVTADHRLFENQID